MKRERKFPFDPEALSKVPKWRSKAALEAITQAPPRPHRPERVSGFVRIGKRFALPRLDARPRRHAFFGLYICARPIR